MIELKIEDMACGHYASTIARTVKDVDAAGRCEVERKSKIVRIDSTQPAAEFVSAIQEAG